MGWRERRAQRTAEALRKGEIIRQLHWQCWRADAPPLETPLADLVEVLPVLIESGSVGLVWPRLWHRAEELGAVGAALAAAYEAQVAHNARVERDIARVVTRLREHGVEPVLIKGLAVARLYPDPLIRTAGDIDLVVRDEDYALAQDLLTHFEDDYRPVSLSFHGDRDAYRQPRGATDSSTTVDMHAYSNWDETPGPGFFEFASPVLFAGTPVDVPSAEDHLRALCKHFLMHGSTRPLRLCDIALLFETHADRMNWEGLLRGDQRDREHVTKTLGISQLMLGLHLDNSPVLEESQRLPRWLIRAVRRQLLWDSKRRTPMTDIYQTVKRPWTLISVLRRNWPDPILSSYRMHAPINEVPRLPVQLAFLGSRVFVFTTIILPRDIVTKLRNR